MVIIYVARKVIRRAEFGGHIVLRYHTARAFPQLSGRGSPLALEDEIFVTLTVVDNWYRGSLQDAYIVRGRSVEPRVLLETEGRTARN